MAKDGRALRDEAAAATAAGKHKRALAAYLELERIEPRDAQWAKRAAETYRKLGNTKQAIEAFTRSAERYAQNGFLVKAIAVCKLILQIDPQHATALGRLAQMNAQVGQRPTRAQGFADNNPALHANPNVDAIRSAPTRGNTVVPGAGAPQPPPVPAPPSTPAIAVPRTKSKPVALPPGAALDTVDLAREMPDSYQHASPGVHIIPLDEDVPQRAAHSSGERSSAPRIEIEIDLELPEADDGIELELDPDDASELTLEDLEELPQPRAIGKIAQNALAATPLFAGLPAEALEALVEELTLISLASGTALFHEGDPGDALYVIVEGEVSVLAEGPPRVEIARLAAGSFIGEVALMTDQPRSATVTAIGAAELLRIDRVTLSKVLANHGDVLRAVLRFVRDRLVDRWIRTSPLFRPFDEQQRDELAGRFQFLEIAAATTLIAAGSRPDGLYIVLAGHCLVQRSGSTVATLGPGDLIGETALLSGAAHTSDVVAREKSLALCLPAAEFRKLIMTYPHVLEWVGQHAEHSRKLQIL